MICEACDGEGYVRGKDAANPGALVMLPCLECNGSGIASCCDTAGSSVRQFPPISASYRDDTFEPRKCDYCGEQYRGPAVYCSLECATDDI